MTDALKSPVKSKLPAPSTSSQIPRKDGSNRKSMLLPPGTMVAASQRTTHSSISAPKQRPLTTSFGNMTSLAELSAQFGAEDDEIGSPGTASATSQEKDDARAAAHARLTDGGESKMQRISRPKIGEISRSQTVRKPEMAGKRPQSMLPPARSTMGGLTTRSSRPPSILVETKRTTVSRSDSSASTTSTKSASDLLASRIKLPPPGNGTGVLRAPTNTARHTRAHSALPSAPLVQGANSGLPRLGLTRRPTNESNTSTGPKPAFSTLQQHYSPQKNRGPKPASATLIHAQPPDADSSPSLETQLLQARLLQLSILHREAIPALQSWEISARQKLGSKFRAVARQYQLVQEKELQVRKDANVSALKEWCNGDSGLLAENIQVLAGVVNEVMQLIEAGGRVEEVIGVFGDWLRLVEGTWDLREENLGTKSVGSEFDFIDGLGETWEAETAGLVRRLSTLGRALEGLDMPRKESSLWDLMSLVKLLVLGAVDELKIVLAVQKEVVEKEKRWVDEKMLDMEADIESVLIGIW